MRCRVSFPGLFLCSRLIVNTLLANLVELLNGGQRMLVCQEAGSVSAQPVADVETICSIMFVHAHCT